jgi:hypothetical protein
MKKFLMIGIIASLTACTDGVQSTVVETKPVAEIDCTQLDPNAADYPEACKVDDNVTPPPPPAPCQNEPCEGDDRTNPAQ